MANYTDDFNRTDQGPPPSSLWVTPSGDPGCIVLGNQLAPKQDAGGAGKCTTAGKYGPDCVATLKIPVLPDTNDDNRIWLYVRRTDQSATPTGYAVCLMRNPQTGYHYVELWEGGFKVGSSLKDLQPGDTIKVEIRGAVSYTYVKHEGGEWTSAVMGGASGFPNDGYASVEFGTTDVATRADDFAISDLTTINAPTGLQAHIVGHTIVLTWHNQPPAYTYLTVQRAPARGGPWSDLGIALSPTDETATDNAPGDYRSFYRVYVRNNDGSAITLPVRAHECVRQTWNDVAHTMGIPDLPPPAAPFTYGEAGEQLFLVCCRLWRLELVPDLPDPVYSEPADWRTFLETGVFPT